MELLNRSTGPLGLSRSLYLRPLLCSRRPGPLRRVQVPAHSLDPQLRDPKVQRPRSRVQFKVDKAAEVLVQRRHPELWQQPASSPHQLNHLYSCWQALSQLPPREVAAFNRADRAWRQLCTEGLQPPRQVAFQHSCRAPQQSGSGNDTYDFVILGGTLGIVIGAALLATHQKQQLQGAAGAAAAAPLRVAVVERGAVAGREQEWNITESDLQVLVDCGVLDSSELEQVVATRFTSVRVGIEGGPSYSLRGVMDCGVSPKALVEIAKRRFQALGGVVLEGWGFDRLDSYRDAALLTLQQQQQGQEQQPGQGQGPDGAAAGGAGAPGAAFSPAATTPSPTTAGSGSSSSSSSSRVLSAQLVLDCLGGFSPISAQARGTARPDSVMLLVGSCLAAAGVGAPARDQDRLQQQQQEADLLWGWTPLDKEVGQQYWWERFPAAGGSSTTAYMFAFTDPAPCHAGLLQHMLTTYLSLLPSYITSSSGSGSGQGAAAASSSSSPAAGGATGQEAPDLQRLVVGFVPCHPERALPVTDRLLPVGDAAGNRSALSLAGFCALVRHLPRVTAGVLEAMSAAALSREELSLLQPYSPAVDASTAMQRSMAVHSSQLARIQGAGQEQMEGHVDDRLVLTMMGDSLSAMWAAAGGERGLRPFLADCLQWEGLSKGIWQQLKTSAPMLLAYNQFLGDSTNSGARLLRAMAGLAGYSVFHAATAVTGPLHELLLAGSPRLLYRWHRYQDAWRYGSGQDYSHPAAAAAAGGGDGGAAAANEGSREKTDSGAMGDSSAAPMSSSSSSSGGGGGGSAAAADAHLPPPPVAAAGAADEEWVPRLAAAPPAASYCRPFGPIIAAASFAPDDGSNDNEDSSSKAEEAAGAAAMASEDTYEDSLLVGLDLGAALAAAAYDPSRYSVDTHEEALEPAAALSKQQAAPAAAAGAAAGGAGAVSSSYEDSLLVGPELGAAALTADDPSSCYEGQQQQEEGFGGVSFADAAKGLGAQLRPAVVAAAAAAPVDWDMTHSVDTYEDYLEVQQGPAAGAAGAAVGDWEMTHSVDTYEDSLELQQGPAAAAVATAAAAAWEMTHSVGTYEDFLELQQGAAGAAAAFDPSRYSMDTYDTMYLDAAAVKGAARSASAAAAAAAAAKASATTAAAAAAAGPCLMGSADSYEDFLELEQGAAALAALDPSRYSVDCHDPREEEFELEARSRLPAAAEGAAAKGAAAGGSAPAAAGTAAAGPLMASEDTYEDSLLVGLDLGAALAAAASDPSRYSIDTHDTTYQESDFPPASSTAGPAVAAAAAAGAEEVGGAAGTSGSAGGGSSAQQAAPLVAGAAGREERVVVSPPGSSSSSYEEELLGCEWRLQAAINALRDATKSVDTYEDALDDDWDLEQPPPPAAEAAAAAGNTRAAGQEESSAFGGQQQLEQQQQPRFEGFEPDDHSLWRQWQHPLPPGAADGGDDDDDGDGWGDDSAAVGDDDDGWGDELPGSNSSSGLGPAGPVIAAMAWSNPEEEEEVVALEQQGGEKAGEAAAAAADESRGPKGAADQGRVGSAGAGERGREESRAEGGKSSREGATRPAAGAWRGSWRPNVDPAAMKRLMECEGGSPDE